MAELNINNLRGINRIIVAVIVLSSDNKILLGKKDPKKGGVYSDAWHTPGGGTDENETLKNAAIRECYEETGINLQDIKLLGLPYIGHGSTEKTLKTGEVVWCNMEFHRFEARLSKKAYDIKITPSDDLVELKWFPLEKLNSLKLIPGAKEFFTQAGYIKIE